MIKPRAKSTKPGAALLAWYDAHRRELPWRARAGEAPDPYRVWLSEIMLQQTTVATVKERYAAFLARWPTIDDLARAPLDDVLAQWAGLGYYARARNLHACALAVVEAYQGRFPRDEAALRRLPGVGPYTAAAIAAIAFDQPCVAVDGNVERVIARLHAIETPPRKVAPLVREKAAALMSPARPGDSVQALMELGALVCAPRTPDCPACPLSPDCAARRLGAQSDYPAREVKAAEAEAPRRDLYPAARRRGVAPAPAAARALRRHERLSVDAFDAGYRHRGILAFRARASAVARARRAGDAYLYAFRAGGDGVRRAYARQSGALGLPLGGARQSG